MALLPLASGGGCVRQALRRSRQAPASCRLGVDSREDPIWGLGLRVEAIGGLGLRVEAIGGVGLRVFGGRASLRRGTRGIWIHVGSRDSAAWACKA